MKRAPAYRVTLACKLRSPLNCGIGVSRGGMLGRARDRRDQRDMAKLALFAYTRGPRWGGVAAILPCVVTLTRIAPSSGLDDDNLRAACKSVRDGVADALGLKSDRDPRVRWMYGQRRGDAGVYQVVILVEPNQ